MSTEKPPTDVDNHVQDPGTLETTPILHLGGFQEAADLLSVLSKHSYSRQAVHQLWKRRSVNSFPNKKPYLINGYTKLYFDMKDVRQWYEFTRTDTSRWDENLVSRSATGRFVPHQERGRDSDSEKEDGKSTS